MATEKKRGIFLTSWLVFMVIINIAVAYFYFAFSLSWVAREWYSDIPFWSIWVVGLLAGSNVLLIIFLFRWKIWAFYGLLAVAIFNFFLNISVGFGIGLALGGLVGPTVLSLLLVPKWKCLK